MRGEVRRSRNAYRSTVATESIAAMGDMLLRVEESKIVQYAGHAIKVRSLQEATLVLGIRAKKLFDFMLQLLTQYNSDAGGWKNDTICFHLDDYLAAINVQQSKQSRDEYYEIILESLETLGNLVLCDVKNSSAWFGLIAARQQWSEVSRHAEKKDVVAGRACFVVTFPQSLLRHFRQNKRTIPFIGEILTHIRQSENAYAVAKRMAWHYFQNVRDDGKKRPNDNRLSVRTLLACCPDMSSERESDIRKRFHSALDVLSAPIDDLGGLLDWKYIYKSKPCTAVEIRRLKLSPEDWRALSIEFTPLGQQRIDKHPFELTTAEEIFHIHYGKEETRRSEPVLGE